MVLSISIPPVEDLGYLVADDTPTAGATLWNGQYTITDLLFLRNSPFDTGRNIRGQVLAQCPEILKLVDRPHSRSRPRYSNSRRSSNTSGSGSGAAATKGRSRGPKSRFTALTPNYQSAGEDSGATSSILASKSSTSYAHNSEHGATRQVPHSSAGDVPLRDRRRALGRNLNRSGMSSANLDENWRTCRSAVAVQG